jgi:sugar lactone lactonase YvrE
MLHESPLCVGIAWERDNVYWVFDGYNDAIVRYDFQDDHEVGQDDHSDGIVYRLTEPTVTRVPDAPGHMVIDPATGLLYVADTGGGRVLRLDTQTGGEGDKLRQRQEVIDTFAEWDDIEWSELVTGLDQPGGLALGDGVLYVAELGTGVLHAYDLDGAEIQTLDTGSGAGAIYGVEIGPDGRLWVVNHAEPAVVRLDPLPP